MRKVSSTDKQVSELQIALEQSRDENEVLRRRLQLFEGFTSSTDSGNETVVEKLHLLLEQQTFLTEILQQLQLTDHLPSTINDIVSRLGRYCNAFSVNLFENSPDGKSVSNTFNWSRERVFSIDQFQNIAFENFPNAHRILDKDKIICANTFEELPSEIKEIFPYRDHVVKLFVNMEHGGKGMGFVYIDRIAGDQWNADEIIFIRKVTDVLATAILRNRIKNELNEYKNNLELLVCERTADLDTSNEELTAINEELYSANSELYDLNERLAQEIKQKDVIQTELERHRIGLEDEIKIRTAELYESETKFRTIVHQLSDLIVIVDIQGIMNYVSPAGIRMLGYTPEEMLGRNIYEFVHPDDMDYAMFEMGKTLDENVPDDVLPDIISVRIIGSGGKVIMVEGVGRNALENEYVRGIILTFSDISAHMAAEQKVRENLEQQQLMSRILQELHYTDDFADSLQQAVAWIAEYLHLYTIILMYRSPDDTVDPIRLTWQSPELPVGYEKSFNIPADIYFNWAEHIKDDLVLVYDYIHLHDSIKPYYNEDSAKRLYAFPFSQHGITCGMMVLTQRSDNNNVVDWKYGEISYIQSLTQIVFNALEKDIAQKHLVKAKEHAEEADMLKSAFLANMSHEIRTPMNGIVGFTSLMQKEDASPKMTLYAHIIDDNCQMLLQLLDDIIDISKLESKQLKMLPMKCNINRLLSDGLMLYQELLKKKGINKVEIILDDNDLNETILVDHVRLRQVLTNLVSNAIKFTYKGYIRFGYTKPDDRQLLFYVKDSGIGIPKNHLNVIFERFRQVEEHSDHNIGGTGIGLAISQSLVEMMGGKIWVESEPGIGSNFYFTISLSPTPS